MYTEKKRLYALDTLKGIMIFAVALYHLPNSMRAWEGFKPLGFIYKYGGDLGNTLFFMLSGLTMCYIYEDKVHALTLRAFVKKRVLSIYDIYLVAGAVGLFLSFQRSGYAALNTRDLALSLLMMTTGWVEDLYPYNYPTWFISGLLLDYIIWFVISKYGKNKKWYIYAFMILLGLSIQKASLQKPFLYYHTGEAMVPFFEGCIFYKLWSEKKSQGKRFVPEIAILSCFLAMNIFVSYKVGFDTASWTWKSAWYAVYAPWMILAALEIRPINRLFESKAMVGIFGNISKYVFFWHVPFLYITKGVLQKIFPDSANARCIVYLIALFAFCIVYRLIEKSVKRRWKETYARVQA